jgi:hypothetical protein
LGIAVRLGRVFEWKCPSCGEREFLIVTEGGELIPVKEGLEVYVLHPAVPKRPQEPARKHTDPEEDVVPWAPPFALKERESMAIYGVMGPKEHLKEGMTRELYSTLYITKLMRLIGQWEGEPLPVLLDRLFGAPYLGAGEPEQIAVSLWQELDEVRAPVVRMAEIFETQEPQAPLADEMVPLVRGVLEGLRLDEFLTYLGHMTAAK